MKKLPYLAPNDLQTYAEIDSAIFHLYEDHKLKTVNEYSPQAVNEVIDPRHVVRAPSFDDWTTSYHLQRTEEARMSDEPSVVEIAKKMVRVISGETRKYKKLIQKADDAQDRIDLEDELVNKVDMELDTIFRGGDIKMKRIEGPRGPIYFVSDGSHRVAASKLVGLTKILASVGGPKDREKAKDLWGELLVKLPEEARHELLRVYDQVYPETKEDR